MEKQERTLGEKVIRAISSGRVDKDLEVIIQSAVNRRRYVQDRAALELLRKIKVGDRVRIARNVKPQYLSGMHGIVERVDRRQHRGLPMVSVNLGMPIRKFRSGTILVPLGVLEMVSPGPVEDEESVRVVDGTEED